ncbi:hypothetical protein EPL05_19750 [Mucilaginibacter gilvus]|uniref:L,D-TPase catalytic domain-containing protein n=1 Tax=Mucilaginibacter gilvus TaxID=2305909 RepID=A0A3S3UQJ0_9SPHI|nr:hypothetical protein EPL05_19750 [Mucilaginibacter gilvus]
MNVYQSLTSKEKDIMVPYAAKLSLIKPGDTASVLPILRKRLTQLGDLTDNTTSKFYDDSLQAAVKRFKTRHGLNVDAQLNKGLVDELNVPLEKRIQQMIINLERLRWIPVDDHGGEFILVNIPEYKLHYYVDNKLAWNCRVVVGKVMTETVIFSGHLQYIVFSPYWYIPPSIIKKEIKPGMARNANYLASHNMEWNGGNVRQLPGVKNSLGLVKFIFPNSNNIYLHDTPAKPLFTKEERAFSHGCIRVGEPRELAIRLLRNDKQWTPEKIDNAMHRGTENTVVLKNKVPVYIGYFTAFVDSQGVLNFRKDVYNRDGRLLELLLQN